MCLRFSYYTVFQSEVYAILAGSEYCISEGIVNKAVSMIVGLLCWPLNSMPCIPELCYSAGILFRNWLCLTEFNWCGSQDETIFWMVMTLIQFLNRVYCEICARSGIHKP
jgi:hypothetical protein